MTSPTRPAHAAPDPAVSGSGDRRTRPDHGHLAISDYGAIGDCRSLALVGVDGSIDWCCMPRFDSPSIFGRLIDPDRGGAWELAPVAAHTSRQQYADKTNILQTIFQTGGGLAIVTDFMPADQHEIRRHPRFHPHPRVIRMVTGLAGEMEFRQLINMRPDYGHSDNPLSYEDGGLHAELEGYHYCFTGSIPLTGVAQNFTVRAGETVAFGLALTQSGRCGITLTAEMARRLLRTTREYWWRWIKQCSYDGPYQVHVWRSALTLKLLTYAPTGAIVAAPTTSLPEWIGGDRNWDYRFTWLRDASFTLYAFFQLGYSDEARDFMAWLCLLATDTGLQNLYDLDGRSSDGERVLPHKPGYRESRPVRVGNSAADQLQLDVFGEILDCAWLFAVHGGQISEELWNELSGFVKLAIEHWEKPDASIWEVRGQNQNFTYSKVMCWVAVDRGMKIAGMLGRDVPDGWPQAATRIHEAVLRQGYSPRLASFTQAFDSEELDASVLRLVQLGFLPDGDDRLRSTITAVDEQLSVGPLVYRYHAAQTDDGLTSPEGTLLICAFWLADSLAITGDLEEAERRFERLLAFGSPLGLFSEEVDPISGGLLGNFPQAFSHLSLISAAVNIERRRSGTLTRTPRRSGSGRGPSQPSI